MKKTKHFAISHIIGNSQFPYYYKITIYQNFKGKPKKMFIQEVNENFI